VAAIFGVAIVESTLLSRWIGGFGVIAGVISIIAGIEIACAGFKYTNFVGLRGISMIIYFIWIMILGVFCGEKRYQRRQHLEDTAIIIYYELTCFKIM
jgi:hypothetical protein